MYWFQIPVFNLINVCSSLIMFKYVIIKATSKNFGMMSTRKKKRKTSKFVYAGSNNRNEREREREREREGN